MEAQQDVVDLLKEAHEMTIIHLACYQQTLHRYHEKKSGRGSSRSMTLYSKGPSQPKRKHKLSPPWEGTYTVTKVIWPGTYQLKDDNGNVLTNTWNIEQLQRFFP